MTRGERSVRSGRRTTIATVSLGVPQPLLFQYRSGVKLHRSRRKRMDPSGHIIRQQRPLRSAVKDAREAGAQAERALGSRHTHNFGSPQMSMVDSGDTPRYALPINSGTAAERTVHKRPVGLAVCQLAQPRGARVEEERRGSVPEDIVHVDCYDAFAMRGGGACSGCGEGGGWGQGSGMTRHSDRRRL